MAENTNEQEGELKIAPKKGRNYKKISLILAIALGVIVIAFIIYLILVRNNKSDEPASATPTATVSSTLTAVKSPTLTPDPTTGWKTHTNSDYGVSFKYPNTWIDPVTTVLKVEQEGIIPVDYSYIDFNKQGEEAIRSVELSKVSTYTTTALATRPQAILDVYNSKDASGVGKIWLPPENAAIMEMNTPKYIQTVDAKYRGVYYFAVIGQDYGINLNLVIVMTDGSDKIVQLQFGSVSNKAGDYPCIASSSGCSEDQLQSQFQSYKDYVKTIDETSTETVVKDFNSTYKYIVQSLKSI